MPKSAVFYVMSFCARGGDPVHAHISPELTEGGLHVHAESARGVYTFHSLLFIVSIFSVAQRMVHTKIVPRIIQFQQCFLFLFECVLFSAVQMFSDRRE